MSRFLLSGKKISYLPPLGSLCGVLRYLSLANNKLEFLSASIGSLGLLRVMDLSGNRLKELPPAFSQLRSLQELFLERNLLREIPPAIRELSALETLSLKDNRIEDLSSLSVGLWPQLKVLTLEGNPLSGEARAFLNYWSVKRPLSTVTPQIIRERTSTGPLPSIAEED